MGGGDLGRKGELNTGEVGSGGIEIGQCALAQSADSTEKIKLPAQVEREPMRRRGGDG